jgi:hypothetical protein
LVVPPWLVEVVPTKLRTRSRRSHQLSLSWPTYAGAPRSVGLVGRTEEEDFAEKARALNSWPVASVGERRVRTLTNSRGHRPPQLVHVNHRPAVGLAGKGARSYGKLHAVLAGIFVPYCRDKYRAKHELWETKVGVELARVVVFASALDSIVVAAVVAGTTVADLGIVLPAWKKSPIGIHNVRANFAEGIQFALVDICSKWLPTKRPTGFVV